MNSKIENPGALSSYGPISSFKAMDEPKSPCSLAKASVAFGGAVTLVGVVLLATGVGAPLGAGLIVLGVGSVLLTEACYLLGGGLLWLQGREEELSAYWRNDPIISCYEEMKNMFSSSASYCLADVDHSDLSEEEFTGFVTTLTKLQADVENVDMGSRYISHLIDPNHPLAKIWEFAKHSAINEEGLERLVQECGLKGKLGRSVVGNVVDVFTRFGHTDLRDFLSSVSNRESLSEAISWTGRVRVSKDLTESRGEEVDGIPLERLKKQPDRQPELLELKNQLGAWKDLLTVEKANYRRKDHLKTLKADPILCSLTDVQNDNVEVKKNLQKCGLRSMVGLFERWKKENKTSLESILEDSGCVQELLKVVSEAYLFSFQRQGEGERE